MIFSPLFTSFVFIDLTDCYISYYFSYYLVLYRRLVYQ